MPPNNSLVTAPLSVPWLYNDCVDGYKQLIATEAEERRMLDCEAGED